MQLKRVQEDFAFGVNTGPLEQLKLYRAVSKLLIALKNLCPFYKDS